MTTQNPNPNDAQSPTGCFYTLVILVLFFLLLFQQKESKKSDIEHEG